VSGILIRSSLQALADGGGIAALKPLQPAQLQPSSLDLRIGARIWQLPCSFLPGAEGIERKLGRLATMVHRTDRDDALVLHQGGIYLAEIEEVLELPADVWGRANPKSSTGRLDVFVRVLTEHGDAYDTVPEGYVGRLFLEIVPQSFHIGVRRGDTLSQLRLGRGHPLLDGDALRGRQAGSAPLCLWSDGTAAPVVDLPGPGVLLSVDLQADRGAPVGYVARRHQPPVDLARRDLPVDRYWTPVYANEGGVVLEPEQFYILATRERLVIPPDLCAELVAFDATKGELRTHYAGFIDSGFGMGTGEEGLPGSRLVLEVRTHDVPFLLEHGQALFRMEFLRNEAVPDVLYGEGAVNHYQGQGLRLAKQFGR
jgi:dCTP deaminase